jgi:hypothetical protein
MTGTTARILLTAALLLMFPHLSVAQQPANADHPSQGSPPPAGGGSPEDVFRLISRLKSTLDHPATPLGTPDPTVPFDETPSLRGATGETPVTPGDQRSVNEGDSIRQKLELLRALMESRVSGAASVPDASGSLSDKAGGEPGPHTGGNHGAEVGSEGGAGSTSASVPLVPGEPVEAGTPAQTEGRPHGAPVFSAPVDPLELGFSLFATGEIQMALKSLESVDATVTNPVDRQWLDYVRAGCLRLGGQRDRAEGLYREMIASSQEGFPVSAAEWWMTWLQRRKQLEADSRQVVEAIDQWQAKLAGEGN